MAEQQCNDVRLEQARMDQAQRENEDNARREIARQMRHAPASYRVVLPSEEEAQQSRLRLESVLRSFDLF